jgi:hypothetical protein
VIEKRKKHMALSIATQTVENTFISQPARVESFKDKTLDLLENKPRLLGKWGVAALTFGQMTKVLPGQSAVVEIARNFFNAANFGLAPKDLVLSVDQFSSEVKEGKKISGLGKAALKIAKVVKDLFKAIASFGYPVLKVLSMPIEGVCALGSAWYASKNLMEQKKGEAASIGPKKLLNTVSNAIDVAGGAIFLNTLVRGSAVSPLLGAAMGLTSLTSALTLHYIDTK